MTKAAIYAGTFDPITLGHLDLIERSSTIFEKLVLAVAVHTHKVPLFTVEERLAMAREVVSGFKTVETVSFEGLLVDFAQKSGVSILIRGIRAYSDFEYEFQMALTNRKLAPAIETLFMMPKEEHSYVSASGVKEIARLRGDISEFVPDAVARCLREKFGRG